MLFSRVDAVDAGVVVWLVLFFRAVVVVGSRLVVVAVAAAVGRDDNGVGVSFWFTGFLLLCVLSRV